MEPSLGEKRKGGGVMTGKLKLLADARKPIHQAGAPRCPALSTAPADLHRQDYLRDARMPELRVAVILRQPIAFQAERFTILSPCTPH